MALENLLVDATGIAFEKNGRRFFLDGEGLLFQRSNRTYDWLLHVIKADVTRDDVRQLNICFLEYVLNFARVTEFDNQCYLNTLEQEKLLLWLEKEEDEDFLDCISLNAPE